MPQEVDLPSIKPGTTIHAFFEHNDVLRRAFWFKFMKNGDMLSAPSFEVGALHAGKFRPGDPFAAPIPEQTLARSRNIPLKRSHATFHPSRPDDPGKSKGVMNLHGIVPTSFDLSTVSKRAVVMVHHLMAPWVYPRAPTPPAGLQLGRVYEGGAPRIVLVVVPLVDLGTADAPLRPGPNVVSFVGQGLGPHKRDLLFQFVVEHDPGAIWLDTHGFMVPRTQV